MKKFLLYTLLLAMAALHAPAAFGQDDDVLDRKREKRAQTGMQFLSVSVTPRAAAMADAMAAVDEASSIAMFYNPASMAHLEGGHLSLGNVQWIADIKYNNASLAFSPSNGQYGVFGLSLVAVDYGELEETIRTDGESGYQDLGTFSPSALAVGVGYAKSLSDRFSVGGNIRYVRQSLGENVMSTDGGMQRQDNTVGTPVFDFGVLYSTGFRSLNLAMTARNFSPAVTYEEESFETPLNLSIGLSMDMMDVLSSSTTNTHSFLLATEASHPRSYAEQFRVGGEYRFMDMLALRAGYVFPSDEQGINLGAGLNLGVGNLRFSADYAYSQFGDLGNVNRVGLQVGF